MIIEAHISLSREPRVVAWTGIGDGHPQLSSETPLAIEALRLMQEAYAGEPIGLPGYPPIYRDALEDPIGFIALCYRLSDRLPSFLIDEESIQ